MTESMFINPPNDIEFIIESNTWDNYILNSVLYDMLLDSKRELIEDLFFSYYVHYHVDSELIKN